MPPPKEGAFLLGERDLAFATDLYQLTMAAAYGARGETPRTAYELYVRGLPENRNFLVFAGLEQVLAALEGLRFSAPQVEFLRSQAPFRNVDPGFFEMLRDFCFRGDVWAMREGSVFFPHEPVIRVVGDLIEAQIVETLLLSIVNFQTLIASKAARVRLAAGPDVQLAEFGTRRAHGPQAGAWSARAAYVGGFDSTSNVFAGQQVGMPIVGTMAHSFVLSFEDEKEAFAHYARVFPEHTVHLVDTYDTVEGVRRAIRSGVPFQGIRLDSGDLLALSLEARRILDDAGMNDVRIFASGGADEWSIRSLCSAGAPIDAFGVGTRLVSSADAPTLGGVYKLVAIDRDGRWVPKRKQSVGKEHFGGIKQVFRSTRAGELAGDRLVPAETPRLSALDMAEEPMLRQVVRNGEVLRRANAGAAREHCMRELSRLPAPLRSLEASDRPYPVEIDPRLSG